MTFLVTALQSEAKPLVDFFELRGSDAASPFRTYRGGEVTLIISGVGRVASAGATAYAFAAAGEPRDRPWINVGIAGHPTAEVGSCWLANKISEASRERSWFPSLVFDPGLPAAELITVDHAENSFDRDALYDMEASAFFATATRFAPVELVQIFKVVSDNRTSPASRLTPGQVSKLISERAEALAELVRGTAELAGRLTDRSAEPSNLEPWIRNRHFTLSQKRRLGGLLRRLEVLEGDSVGLLEQSDGPRDARAVLAILEQRLRRQGVAF